MARAHRCAWLAAALMLGGCSSDSDTSWPQLYAAAKASLTGAGSEVTLQQAAAVPYASLALHFGDDREQMVVLAASPGNGLLWTSAAKIALSTQNGRVMRTAGFSHNLSATVFAGKDPLESFRDPDMPTRDSSRQVDFWDLNLFAVPLRCQLVSRGKTWVIILGKKIPVHRVDENCESKTLDWSFTNNFWMDGSGFVWESLQHLHPKQDAITMKILRPPANAHS